MCIILMLIRWRNVIAVCYANYNILIFYCGEDIIMINVNNKSPTTLDNVCSSPPQLCICAFIMTHFSHIFLHTRRYQPMQSIRNCAHIILLSHHRIILSENMPHSTVEIQKWSSQPFSCNEWTMFNHRYLILGDCNRIEFSVSKSDKEVNLVYSF